MQGNFREQGCILGVRGSSRELFRIKEKKEDIKTITSVLME